MKSHFIYKETAMKRKKKKKNLLQQMENCNSFATKNSFYCINTLSDHINLFCIAINSKTIT